MATWLLQLLYALPMYSDGLGLGSGAAWFGASLYFHACNCFLKKIGAAHGTESQMLQRIANIN